MIDAAQDNLIRLADVALRFDVSYRTAKSWVDDGDLEAVKVGGSWYTTAAALNAYATREKIGSASPKTSPSYRGPGAIVPRVIAASQSAMRERLYRGLALKKT